VKVVLVRHAMPTLDPDQAPEDWPLSPGGRLAAAALRPSLPGAAVRLASTERKAVETLALATDLPPVQDIRFGEVARPGEPFDDDVRDRRRAWVEGRPDQRHRGWERPGEAAARFGAALADHASDLPLVVATHGMVLTAWLVSVGHVDAGAAAGRLWAELAFPDVVHASTGDGESSP
jgi:broad specificity phosphatase PhoE